MPATTSIRNALSRPSTVLCLIAAYFVLSVAFRLLRSDALQNDEAEQLFQSQFLLWGYGRQPPFYNWLQMGMFELFGTSVAALSILKNLLLFLTCVLFGLAGRQVLKDRAMPAAAALGVLTLPATLIMAQRDLTHAIATFCFVALFLFAFLRTLTRPSLGAYLLTGIVVGLGLITKYNFVILPVAAILAALADEEFRKRVLDWRLLPALIVAGLICLPHALWVMGNLQEATEGTITAMREDASGNAVLDRIEGLLSMLLSAIEGSVPTLVFFAIAFPGKVKAAWRAQSRWTRLTGLILVISLVMVAMISLGFGASSIRQKWLAPFMMVLPLYVCLKLDAAGIDARPGLPRLTGAILGVAFVFIAYLFAANVVGPMFNKYGKENIPYRAFYQTLLSARAAEAPPSVVITDDLVLAGVARMLFPDAKVRMPGDGEVQSEPEDVLPRGTVLVVWLPKQHKVLPPLAPARLTVLLDDRGISTAEVEAKALSVPYQFSDGASSATFGYAWIANDKP